MPDGPTTAHRHEESGDFRRKDAPIWGMPRRTSADRRTQRAPRVHSLREIPDADFYVLRSDTPPRWSPDRSYNYHILSSFGIDRQFYALPALDDARARQTRQDARRAPMSRPRW